MNIDAMRWKYPTAEFTAHGELIYENIKWVSDIKPTEADLIQAEVEYLDYLQNDKPLEDAKKKKIAELREQYLDQALQAKITAVNNAQNQTAIDAVIL